MQDILRLVFPCRDLIFLFPESDGALAPVFAKNFCSRTANNQNLDKQRV